MESAEVDVLVVGGGPVGVMTALMMARRGLTVTVVERATEIYDLPRAIGMDDEIQRLFVQYGLGDDLSDITSPMGGAEFIRPNGEQIIGVPFPVDANWPLGHHPTVAYYQPQLEETLRTRAAEAGVELCFGVDAGEVDQTADGVAVHCVGPDGAHVRRARWLVAADGASSGVRKQLDIPFVDQGFDQDWLVLDLELRGPMPSLPTFAQQICDPSRPTTVVPGHRDYRRWEFQLQPGETREEMTDPDRIWTLLQPWLTPDDARLVRAVVYRFHATVADRMRDGRVFLAGDAAHQMPPFLGQGLCSGVRDGANLAWKLALIDRGVAPADPLLDTYDTERRPHAADTVAHAVATGQLIDALSGRGGEENLDAAYGGQRRSPYLTDGLLVDGHPAVGRQLPQPMVGDTRLDTRLGSGFAVLLDEATPADAVDTMQRQWAALAANAMFTTTTIPCAAMPHVLPAGGAVVVRPDRYVAAVAETTDELAAVGAELLAAMGVQPGAAVADRR